MRSRYEDNAFASYLGKSDYRNQSVISSRPVTVVSSTLHTCHTSLLQTSTRVKETPSDDEYPECVPPSPTSSEASRYEGLSLDDLDIIKTIGE